MNDIKYDYILCRFGELTTKGKNRKDFIDRLFQNIKKRLKDYPLLSYEKQHDAIIIHLNGIDHDTVCDKLKTVYGLSNYSGAIRCARDLDDVKAKALALIKKHPYKTFKVNARRQDKSYPLNSDMINREIAGHILRNSDVKVDVHHPDIMLYVIVKNDRIYLMDEKIQAAGGYPVGINGKTLVMMSGGIDSPVAASMMMKRGMKVECLHFASMPYTSKQALDKVLDLVKILTDFQDEIKVHIIPFTDLQVKIYEHTDTSYAITILRRMMYRIADEVCRRRHIKMIANGESLGQVASQTPESLSVIGGVSENLIIRPLACLDKIEIIDMAKKIGTYETSILPFEDCCTIFAPKDPVTKPHADKCEYYESKFDWAPYIKECVDKMETIIIKNGDTRLEEDLF